MDGKMTKTDWPREIVTPETVELLDGVLKAWCLQNGCSLDSDLARKKARSLMDWSDLGVRDAAELARLLDDDITLPSDE